MAKLRPAPFAAAFALFDVWRRLTPKQRAELTKLARKHGPTLAKQAVKLRSRFKS